MARFIILRNEDNVGVALEDIPAGTALECGVTTVEIIPDSHKFALKPIPAGQNVLKYGTPIGHAQTDIAAGAWVHCHNVKTNLAGTEEYTYKPVPAATAAPAGIAAPTFKGYRRANGKAGIRNEIWVIATVGCVNRLVDRLAADGEATRPAAVNRVAAITHPYGCSQMGTDHEATRTILSNLALHPNAGGVLFVGLGCENNQMADFRKMVEAHPDHNPNIRYMVAQDEDDEFATGKKLLRELMDEAAKAVRVDIPASELIVGMKCGGSDGLSGVTANPLVGYFSDWLIDRGGRTVLTEVPEMFGAERGLLNRAANDDVFARGVDMINGFKEYFIRYKQVVYENPSPGNHAGGITTLEDKSIGCTQKGGTRAVVDIQPYGGVVSKAGLTLLSGPGNDIVSVSALTAAGAHLILFTTGRGNPLGAPVPVVKVASNAHLATRKAHWIDFDASPLAAGAPRDEVTEQFAQAILRHASGEPTKSEINGFHDFAIFKDGVTL